MAVKCAILLALVLSVSSENTRLKEVFSWKTVEFQFPKDSDRADAIKSGAFVPDNNLPLGLDVWKDKLFITVPRWKSGVVSSLNYIDISGVEIPGSDEELEEEPTPITEIEASGEIPPKEEEEEDEDDDDDDDGGLVGGVGDLVGGENGVLDTVGGVGDLVAGEDGVLGGVGDLVGGENGVLDTVGGVGDLVAGEDGVLGGVGDLVTGGEDGDGLLGGVGNLVTGGDGDGPLDAVGGLLTGDDEDEDDGGLLGTVGDAVTGGEDGDGPLDAVGGLLTGDDDDEDNGGLLGTVGDAVTGGEDGDGPLDAVGGLLPGGEEEGDDEDDEEGLDEDSEGDEEEDSGSETSDESNEESEEPSSSGEESPDKRITSQKRNSLGEQKYQRVKRSLAPCSETGCETNQNSTLLMRKKTTKKVTSRQDKKKKKKKTKTADKKVPEKAPVKKETNSKKKAVQKNKTKRPIIPTASQKKNRLEKPCRDALGNPCGIPFPDPVYSKPSLKPPKKKAKSKKKKNCKPKKTCKKACIKPANVSATSPALIPYPDLATNTPSKDAKGPKITSVFRVRVDACDRLWVMDTGIADILGNTEEYSKPQILVYDLNTDKLVKQYVFKSEDVQEQSFFANIIVDVEKSRCDEAFAYVPDLGSYAIVVYDLKKDKAWRIKHHYFHFNPLEGNYNVGGENFQWTDGVFGIALTKPNPDKSRTAYFHALSSYSEFMVNTLTLQNEQEGKQSNYTAYQLVGNKGPNSQTSASFIHEPTGIMFYTQVNKDAVYCWNTNKPFSPENLEEVASDPTTMIFPNDLKVDYNDNLWVLTDKLPIFVMKGLDSKAVNYRVFVSQVSKAITNTNCAP